MFSGCLVYPQPSNQLLPLSFFIPPPSPSILPSFLSILFLSSPSFSPNPNSEEKEETIPALTIFFFGCLFLYSFTPCSSSLKSFYSSSHLCSNREQHPFCPNPTQPKSRFQTRVPCSSLCPALSLTFSYFFLLFLTFSYIFLLLLVLFLYFARHHFFFFFFSSSFLSLPLICFLHSPLSPLSFTHSPTTNGS